MILGIIGTIFLVSGSSGSSSFGGMAILAGMAEAAGQLAVEEVASRSGRSRASPGSRAPSSFRSGCRATTRRRAICLSRRVLDLPCPGCGLTRAFAHLAKGEWREALVLHPLSPIVAAELGVGWGAWGLALAGRLPQKLWRQLELLAIANAAALIALWLGRAAAGTLPW